MSMDFIGFRAMVHYLINSNTYPAPRTDYRQQKQPDYESIPFEFPLDIAYRIQYSHKTYKGRVFYELTTDI
jgi:hypothetical protein